MSPRRLFRTVAIAEAITWAMLLTGMFLKYVTETTDLGVRIGGMAHGLVFVAYCLTTIVVAVDSGWSMKRLTLGLLAAVPPFFTIWFDLAMEKRGALSAQWRLNEAEPRTPVERFTAWLVRKPVQGLAVGSTAVIVLTGLALIVGPPTS